MKNMTKNILIFFLGFVTFSFSQSFSDFSFKSKGVKHEKVTKTPSYGPLYYFTSRIINLQAGLLLQLANSLASAIESSPSKLRTAYDRGQHCYVVSVYANVVKPSLSKIAYVYYTNQTLRFVEK